MAPTNRFSSAGLSALIFSSLAGCASGTRSETVPIPAEVTRGAFVVRLGNDTLSVESYTRVANRIEGDAVMRSPQTALRHYVVTLGPGGSATETAFNLRRMNASAPPQNVTMSFGADTVVVTAKLGDSTSMFRVAAANATPFLNHSYALMELAVQRALATGRDSVSVTIVPIGTRQAMQLPIARVGSDSVRIWFFGYPYRARIDMEGRILGLDGLSTTQKVLVERVASADVYALAAMFAARDAQRAMGQLSPRDSIAATIGAGHVTVNYGRPAKRGRKVMGGIVPWDTVWRTGANAATGFTTDVDLVMGGVTIPAGKYSLWTIPSPSGWKLIVNKQTGQWGTEYKQSEDLARIDMQRETLATPVEQFTIAVEPTAGGGVLSMAWDDTRVFVAFSPKP